MKKSRILIVDDHALLRRGLKSIIQYQKDMEVVGEAENGKVAVQQAKSLLPDLVVMDLVMPVMDGVEATRLVKAESPQTKVLILTTFGTSADISRALEAGASGAIMKETLNSIPFEIASIIPLMFAPFLSSKWIPSE